MTETRRILAIGAVAVLVASPAPAQPAFQHLLEDLQSPRESTRAIAVRAISTSGHPDADATLVPLLSDPSNTVQLETIDGLLALALAPPPDAALGTPLRTTHGSVAWSVFELGPLAVLPRTWPPRLISHLGAALQDDDARVRIAAAGALGVLASPPMGALPEDVREPLTGEIVAALRHPEIHTRTSAARAAGAIFAVGRPGAPAPVAIADALFGALNDTEPEVRAAASEALGWVRDARAEPALRERYAFFERGEEAESALHALARIAGPALAAGQGGAAQGALHAAARIAGAGSAPLFGQALGSRDTPVRVIAAEGLGRLRDRSAVPVLTAAMQKERDESVLLAAAFAFFLLGERSNLDRVVAALASPARSRQARAYLTELGADVAPDLQPWLRHGNPVLRRSVAEVLGLSGHAGSETALQDVARGDLDRAAAEAARQAVIRLRALPHGARTR